MQEILYSQDKAGEIASDLLDIKAIKLSVSDPFTWSSGWNSPIYCDNRLALSFPPIRTKVKQYLSEMIAHAFPGVEAIAGVATAGIPQGALVAEELGIPFIYVRSKAKGHGLSNQIEGLVVEGQKVVVLEDLISTGGSSLKAVEALRAANIEVLGMAAIFTYGFDIAAENFKNAGVNYRCLSNYATMIDSAAEKGYIKEEDKASLTEWRNDPAGWGK